MRDSSTGSGSHPDQLRRFTTVATENTAGGIRRFSADIVKLEQLVRTMIP